MGKIVQIATDQGYLYTLDENGNVVGYQRASDGDKIYFVKVVKLVVKD